MLAIQIDRPRHVRLVEVPNPRPAEGEVLVRLERLSICGSDMRAYRVVWPEEQYPMPPGFSCHECAGTIVESQAEGWREGQRVIVLPPGLQGGAQFVSAPANRLIALPDEGDLTQWVVCQPFGTVLYAVSKLGNVVGKKVGIIGQGAIGLSFTYLLARMWPSELLALDPIDHRLEVARHLGATRTANPDREDVRALVQDLTGGQGLDLVVEAVGGPEPLDLALDLVRYRGTVVAFGLPERERMGMNYERMMRQEIQILPTVQHTSPDPTRFIAETVHLITQGRLDLSWMVTHRMSFREADRAYDLYERRADGVIKVVMTVD